MAKVNLDTKMPKAALPVPSERFRNEMWCGVPSRPGCTQCAILIWQHFQADMEQTAANLARPP
jgi:hypothetical protein